MTVLRGSEKFSAAAVPFMRPTRMTIPAIKAMSFIGFEKLPHVISPNIETSFFGEGEIRDCQSAISIPAESRLSFISSGKVSPSLSAPLDS